MDIRLGIIGTGRIAQRFAATAKKVCNVTIACVYNPNQESADTFADMQGISQATNQWDIFVEQIDAAYIASPHGTHASYVKALLEVGRHVLCEKPMCLRGEEAVLLYQLAEQMHCVLMEAVKTAYCPGFQAMMDMAKSGKIGKIRDVEACFTKLTPGNLREMTDLQYGGSVTELGSYVLLPIWKLMGTDYTDLTYQSIYAENGVDIYTKLIFAFEEGLAAAKTGLGVKSEGQLVISGTKGYILCESPWWLTRKFEIRYEDPNRREVYEYPYEGTGLQYELNAFLHRIFNTETPLDRELTSEESIANARVMEFYLQQKEKRRTMSMQ